MNINLVAPINSLGYGLAGLNITKALVELGHKVALFPVGNMNRVGTSLGVYDCDNAIVNDPKYQKILLDTIKNTEFYDSLAPCVRIWHQNNLSLRAGRGKSIGFPIFELNRFSDVELHHLKSQDALMVCSHWAKTMLEWNGVECPIYVVPLGVDTTIFKDGMTRKMDNKTRFIHIGKWELRKGGDVIVEAFNRAFTDKDDVELTMACHNPFLTDIQTKEWHTLYKSSPLGSKIQIISGRFETQNQLAALINRADVGIFPARAEGWNLDLLECMAMGLSVIATNVTAHTEFCNKDNAYLVDCPNLETAYDGIWFKGQGEWAEVGEPQIEQIVEYMRLLHNKRKENGHCYNEEGFKTGRKFSWLNSANALVSALEK